MLSLDIAGLHVPDAGPVFLAALAVHVAAGATAVVACVVAATARKRPGRHPRAGTVYLYAITVVFGTATVMAVLRWRQDWHLFLIAAIAFGLAVLGWTVRRRRPSRWMAWHGGAMAGSCIALFTGFYVDNGPQLPLWNRLPHVAYWLIPAAVGIPLTWRALVANGAIRRSRLPTSEPARNGSSAAQPADVPTLQRFVPLRPRARSGGGRRLDREQRRQLPQHAARAR